jgi:hypothetical protein
LHRKIESVSSQKILERKVIYQKISFNSFIRAFS